MTDPNKAIGDVELSKIRDRIDREAKISALIEKWAKALSLKFPHIESYELGRKIYVYFISCLPIPIFEATDEVQRIIQQNYYQLIDINFPDRRSSPEFEMFLEDVINVLVKSENYAYAIGTYIFHTRAMNQESE